MIVRDRPSPLRLFFVMQGSIVPRIAPQIICIFILGCLDLLLHRYYPAFFSGLTAAPFALMGLALSIFLGFRNSASYDRWWEARKQWGQLVIDTRSLARQVNSLMPEKGETGSLAARKITRLSIAFTHALRHHLRGTDAWSDIGDFLDHGMIDDLKRSRNLPDALLRQIGQELGRAVHSGLISDVLYRPMEERLTSMASVQAACERIHTTPLPFAYNLLLHRTAYLYCFLLPFGLASTLGLLTPLVSAIIAYTLFGLDALSEELEGPFGTSAHDLALSAISRTVEVNLRETLDEQDLPADLTPDNFHLC
ncbi:bestrophin family protein [Aestuariispira insulae]|uniref:Putative membrane protein n=1 Tax=Aestuariispira insulae TaxID=1461337 RepID=A0A3D9H9F6_9PROT|nr:bestrophin family ion channel [Aestuariispira insulae]RED46132.1 putative membrane protein [Aestuariispira insulae]